ncbi:hypothetical protein A2215_04465 [Candidatus Berkelbacteria bacterium RIFOXYA2_FULL_43_10]|uniref:Uncharacterized protein n=1 Tax=Candidatus Berkelbacteria bacterium RIFOXYA2_FULL_43_10 TaxID=1797472 RepID=A0A1F5E3P7_9BACT|nr:MAG: hypothetical protein A2215_04465 [Candidatus Berkelbacteria bacterium RIFOXYA2_FULL_43_10]
MFGLSTTAEEVSAVIDLSERLVVDLLALVVSRTGLAIEFVLGGVSPTGRVRMWLEKFCAGSEQWAQGFKTCASLEAGDLDCRMGVATEVAQQILMGTVPKEDETEAALNQLREMLDVCSRARERISLGIAA